MVKRRKPGRPRVHRVKAARWKLLPKGTESKGAELLYEFRKYKQLSQSALAALLGVDPSEVSRIERCVQAPGLAFAVQIEALTRGQCPCGAWIEPRKAYQD